MQMATVRMAAAARAAATVRAVAAAVRAVVAVWVVTVRAVVMAASKARARKQLPQLSLSHATQSRISSWHTMICCRQMAPLPENGTEHVAHMHICRPHRPATR